MQALLEKTTETIIDLSQILGDVVLKLETVLQQETALLKTREMDAVMALQDEKYRLLSAYENAILHLTENQPVTLSESCKVAIRNLQGVLAENKIALKAARDSRRFVLQAIREAANEEQSKRVSYGPNRKPVQAGLSLTLDQQL